MYLCMDLFISQTVIIEELIEKISPFNITCEKDKSNYFYWRRLVSVHPLIALFALLGVLRGFPIAAYSMYASLQTLVWP